MRLVAALLVILCPYVNSVHAQNFEPNLPISERLGEKAVLLLGWMHSSSNLLIPKIILSEINQLLDKNLPVSIVIEWPLGMTEDFYSHYPAGANMASLGKTLDALRVRGAEIIPGDPPEHSPENDVGDKNREAHLAMSVEQAYRAGRKVLLVVGGGHLLGISRKLRRNRVPFTSILTRYNVLTGAVRWGDTRIGTTDYDYRFMDGRWKFPESQWDEKGWGPSLKDPENDKFYAGLIDLGLRVNSLVRRCSWSLKLIR